MVMSFCPTLQLLSWLDVADLFHERSFYFVSDPTLLEILSLGSDPPSVVPHFQSGLFDSLTNVTFDRIDKTRMTEMFSQQNEKVSFGAGCPCVFGVISSVLLIVVMMPPAMACLPLDVQIILLLDHPCGLGSCSRPRLNLCQSPPQNCTVA